MNIALLRNSPYRSQRRSIALVTAAFVILSGVLHFSLGGMLHAPWAHQPEQQRATTVTLEHFPTPPPTPKPTPRPTPVRSIQPVRKALAAPRKPRFSPKAPLRSLPVRLPATTATGSIQQPATPLPQNEDASPLPEASPEPTDARDIIITARFVKRVEPVYPQIAVDAGAEGTVIILVTIGPDGSASDVRVWQSSGNTALDRAALQAAEQSTYAPPEVNGQPATQTYRIIYTFYLS